MTGLGRVFPVRVVMLSDWIVGTGEGRVGDVDATVRRDADGLPFVPAKTLTGIWRDACEQVAAWLDSAGTDTSAGVSAVISSDASTDANIDASGVGRAYTGAGAGGDASTGSLGSRSARSDADAPGPGESVGKEPRTSTGTNGITAEANRTQDSGASADEPADAARPSWAAWVDRIFGSQPDRLGDRTAVAGRAPQPAALALSPAYLPAGVRQACRSRPALQAAAVFLRPGVAVDDELGVARDDMFRLEERARPAVLEAVAEFDLADGAGLPRAAEFLLRAGAAALDRLGGKRNRGSGRCWLLLPGMASPASPLPVPATPRPVDERLAELAADTTLIDNPGQPPAQARAAVALVVHGAGPGAMRSAVPGTAPGNVPDRQAGLEQSHAEAVTGSRVVYRVVLEVLTPLVAQDRVLGNVVLSRDFVPGSMLLPEILRRLVGVVSHRDLVVGDARPATLDAGVPVPGRPAPMIWHRPKERHKSDVINAAERCPGPTERRKAMRSGHVARAGTDTWQLLAPAMAVSAHAVVDDDQGRPTQDRGGVFSYVGLAPGTVLVSEIVLPAAVRLRLTAGDRLRLGRSAKDDFGRVEVADVRKVTPSEAPAAIVSGQVRIWCVSDVLLRDELGAPDPRPRALAATLAPRLQVPVTAVDAKSSGPVTRAHRAARRDSFHARWGRPRPSLVGLAAGSVVTVQLGGPVPGDRIVAVQRDGIGERTAEGFGQVRFDAAEVTVAAPELHVAAARGGNEPSSAGTGTASGLPPAGESDLPPAPDPLELAAVQAEIARRVASKIIDGSDQVVPGASGVRSRAQWGSLHDQVARLSTAGGREAVERWFSQSQEVRRRRDTWGKQTLEALRDLLLDEDRVWTKLGLDDPDALDPFLLAPGRAEAVRAALRLHAVSVLVRELARDATRKLQSQDGQR